MSLRRHLQFAALFLCLSSSAFATSGFDMKQLSSLFDLNQRGKAYQYASQYLAEQEGDPYFDYYYGVSAIDSGFASQGVFALERVLLAFPEDPVARLELARGYFILQEYARSKQEFETVLETDPPDGVRDTADLYLDKIRLEESRYKTTVSGSVELGAGYDTNVNSAPSGSFNSAAGTSSTKLEDNFYNLFGAVKVVHPFSPGWKVNVSASGALKKNQDESQFDTLTATLQTGLSLASESSLYNLDFVAQEFQLDGDSYRQLLGLNLGWRYDLSEQSNFTTSLQYAQLTYDIFPILDSNLYTLNVGYTRQFSVSMAPVFFSSLKLGMEDAKSNNVVAQANTERAIYSLRLGIALSLSPKFILQTAAGIQNSQYKGDNAEIGDDKREDNFINADLNLLWLISHKWRLDTRLAYVDNSSNSDIREYNRWLASINLNYNF